MPAPRTPDAPQGPELPVAVGEVLAGKYRVERLIGIGGMGLVAGATHLTLGQRVALKFLLPEAMVAPETEGRFLREAQAAVRLRSEHVAKVLDVGRLDGGAPYMVMEYLEGATLGQLVRQHGPLPVAEAVGYVLQACEGVAEAHAAGIIHRDLKPDNLFLTRGVDGQALVKVLDFGIAKTTGANLQLSLTRTATIVGSPLYMPPEQLRSAKHVDARADIWGLGAVLFELLAGRAPFLAESFSELCMKVAQDPPPAPSSLRSEVTPELDAVVLRCLEKDVAKRFQNVGDLALALQMFAPEDARDLARRISSVLKVDTKPAMPIPAIAVLPVSAALQKDGTGAAWGKTSAQARARRTLTWIGVAIGVGSVVVAGVAARVVRGGSPEPPASSQAGRLVPPPPDPAAAMAPATPVALVPASVPSEAPSTAPSASNSAAAAVPAVSAAPPRRAVLHGTPATAAAVAASASPAASARPSASSDGDIVFQRK